MSLIDTYQLATCGQNLTNTFTLASNGILVDVTIEDVVIPIPTLPPGANIPYPYPSQPKEEIKKRITVIATINNIEYKESILIDNIPNLTIDDVEVDILDIDIKPKITIKILK